MYANIIFRFPERNNSVSLSEQFRKSKYLQTVAKSEGDILSKCMQNLLIYNYCSMSTPLISSLSIHFFLSLIFYCTNIMQFKPVYLPWFKGRGILSFLCPFALYYVPKIFMPNFLISRIFLVSGA
jgi:hypothetical protein